MNNELYTELVDDAQQYIGSAIDKLQKARDELMKSGHPGIRLSNRGAEELCIQLSAIKQAIDNLPAPENDQ